MASYTTPDPGLLAELLLLIVVPLIVSDPPMNWTPPPGTLVWFGVELSAWLPVMMLLLIARLSAVAALEDPAMIPAPPKTPSAPPVIVTPETVPATPPTRLGSKSRTRLWPPASIVVVAAPAPSSDTFCPLASPIASSPFVRS